MKAIRQIAFKVGLYVISKFFQSRFVHLATYTLVDKLFREKHLYIIFQKQWVRDIPNYEKS